MKINFSSLLKSILASSVSLLVLYSCSQHPSAEGCYKGGVGQDSVFLNIQTEGVRNSGKLVYQFLEKDDNTGSIEGQLLGDTLLLLEYTFMSEGIESNRQVAYLFQGENLIEGYGELEEVEGSMRFKDVNNLSFGEGFVLHKTDCRSKIQ